MSNVPTISRHDLAAALQGPTPPVLLEALAQRYFDEGHLPGAIALPPDELRERIGDAAPDRGAPVVVYCASATCANSHQVAARLVQLGYTDVAVYPGGKADWVDGGLPLAR
jgi:rhodanese-related sulfurtransferase